MVTKICQFCGKEYQTGRNSSKSCSSECCHKGFGKKVEVQCEWCGETLLRAPYRIRRTKHQFCNAEHKQNWMTTITGVNHPLFQTENRTCLNCGKTFLIKPSTKEKYCSLACYAKHKKNRENCVICGKEVRRKGSKYCSQECMGIDRHKRINKVCSICGAMFTVRPCEDKGDKNVCSKKCADKYKHQNPFVYQQIMIQNMKNYPRETSIEKAIKEWLKTNKINHIPQCIINDKFCVDFYLPDHNVIIEALGDYWHGNPNKYGENKKPLNETQIKCINKDKARFPYLRKCGYSVYGFWECDIRSDLDSLMDSIKELKEHSKNENLSV